MNIDAVELIKWTKWLTIWNKTHYKALQDLHGQESSIYLDINGGVLRALHSRGLIEKEFDKHKSRWKMTKYGYSFVDYFIEQANKGLLPHKAVKSLEALGWVVPEIKEKSEQEERFSALIYQLVRLEFVSKCELEEALEEAKNVLSSSLNKDYMDSVISEYPLEYGLPIKKVVQFIFGKKS